jgi:hypothetical protein
MLNFKELLSALNRMRKKIFPSRFVSQKKYNNLQSKYNILVDSITSIDNKFTQQALMRSVISPSKNLGHKEICFFVSYTPTPLIKPHVEKHIKALQNAGIGVILVINTDDIEGVFSTPPALTQLCGLYIRENKGFDFGAWSQIYEKLHEKIDANYLYLINDSMVGPLSEVFFDDMLKKIHASDADFIGLTSNPNPNLHLQSFFLVLRRSILKNDIFKSFFKSLWQLPTKEMVIDFYEVRITGLLQRLGYKMETLFPTDDLTMAKTDAVIHNLDALLERGFPYMKTSVIHTKIGQKILKKY